MKKKYSEVVPEFFLEFRRSPNWYLNTSSMTCCGIVPVTVCG
jgi:hypothetical protein